MAAFAILNRGTAYDRNLSGELVGEIGRAMAGQEARVEHINGEPVFFDGSYMVNDGPGSSATTRPGNINPYPQKNRGWGIPLC